MFIKAKLTEKDFINLNFILLFRNIFIKIFTGIMIFAIAVSLITALIGLNTSFSPVFTSLFMVVVLPAITYFSAKKNYKANQRIGETIEYQFGENDLIIKGESFNAQLTLEKIYKVTQTSNWVLIWQNKQSANPIPKRDIGEGQVEALKIILDRHKIKNNL